MLASFINKYIISPKEWSSLIESTRLSHQARNGNRLGWPTSSRRMLLGMEYSLELGFQASLPSVLAGIGCTIFFCTVACWPRPDRIYGSPFFSFPPQVGPTWYWQIPWHVPQSGVEHRARGHTQSLYLAVLCRAALHAGDHTYLRVPLIRVLNAVWTKKSNGEVDIYAALEIDSQCLHLQSKTLTRNRTENIIAAPLRGSILFEESNLVGSASSIRLSQRLSNAWTKYKLLYGKTANGSLYQFSLFDGSDYIYNSWSSRGNRQRKARLLAGMY